jgi:hypothetical protein
MVRSTYYKNPCEDYYCLLLLLLFKVQFLWLLLREIFTDNAKEAPFIVISDTSCLFPSQNLTI